VFGVAAAAGATLQSRRNRYFCLVAYLTPLGVLGYFLPEPFGLVPIGWALISAIAISRRWAWVEDDRETAMLNGKFVGDHIKIGFAQDLRDEALLAFSSMFLLVPLALRQTFMWGEAHALPVFALTDVNPDDMTIWVQYFGSELAKAVPFVDWAEIYDVEGQGPIAMTKPLGQHVVFATRVLVDLVFLAALLQALSTLARNAKQSEMFKSGVLDRLDPFIEQREFRRLVQDRDGAWRPTDAAHKFRPGNSYDLTRLIELKKNHDDKTPLGAAARYLFDRDYRNANVSAELHAQLLQQTSLQQGQKPDLAAIAATLQAIQDAGDLRQISDLDDARRALKSFPTARDVRKTLIEMIAAFNAAEDKDDQELQTLFLSDALSAPGGFEPRVETRKIAFEALKARYLAGDDHAFIAIQRAASSDPSGEFRKTAAGFIAAHPRSTPLALDDSSPAL
jgi:hypothetical protein